MLHRSHLFRFAAALAVVTASTSFAAIPATWIGTTGNWTTPGNWSTGLVPIGSTYDVLIPAGSVTINSTTPGANTLSLVSGASLFLSSSIFSTATLSTGNFTNAGVFTIDAGTQTGPTGTASALTLIGTLLNTGTINLANPYNFNQAQITGGSLTNVGTLNFTVAGFTSLPITNSGLVTIAPGTAASPHNVAFTGNTTFTQSAGTMDLSAPFTSATFTNLTYNGGTILGSLGGPGDDLYIDQLILPNGLAQLASISSSGPSIFYNASNPFNAYLNNLTLPLGNGGFLAPAPIPEPATLWLLPLALLICKPRSRSFRR